MIFGWMRNIQFAALGAAIALAVIAFVDFAAYGKLPVCDYFESGLVCARNWVNAVAVVAAAFTILFLFRQVREQAKQTAFLLGNSKPTFDVYSEEGRPTIYFRIVNWNRRTFVVDSVESKDLRVLNFYYAKLEHAETQITLRGSRSHLDPPIRVAAYDDRSRAPAILRLEGVGAAQVGKQTAEVTFKLRGRLLGERHEHVTLVASSVVVHLG